MAAQPAGTPESTISRIGFRSIGFGSSTQAAAFAFVLFLNQIGIITLNQPYGAWITGWVLLNVMASPVLARSRFVTPRVARPKCPFCGGFMTTIKLKCEACGRAAE